MALEKLTAQQIKENPQQQLKNFKKTKDFLVAIDTDGCVTDNMNGKQMLIFHPHFMEFYGLWDIESYFREIAEYYNLFSVHRGCNRFLAIQFTLKDLYLRKDVQKAIKEKSIVLPDPGPLDAYISHCTKNNLGLGNATLEKFLESNPMNFMVYKLLGWSEAVNRTFPFVNLKIPPFGNVKNSLKMMSEFADVIVVSQTPYDDLVNYWEYQGLAGYIHIIAGQEMGTKTHHIEAVKKTAGYTDQNVLMLGDGDGDLKAIKKNNGLFYPVAPGFEEEAWDRFPENFKLFLEGKYAGKIENNLLSDFSKVLLSAPEWEQPEYNHVAAYRKKQEIRKSLYAKLNPAGRLLVL